MGQIAKVLSKKIFKIYHRNYFTAKKDIIQRPIKLLSVLDEKKITLCIRQKKLLSVLDKTKVTLCIKQKKCVGLY